MSCQPNQAVNCEPVRPCGNGGFVIIIVLYILLAIILGAWRCC